MNSGVCNTSKTGRFKFKLSLAPDFPLSYSLLCIYQEVTIPQTFNIIQEGFHLALGYSSFDIADKFYGAMRVIFWRFKLLEMIPHLALQMLLLELRQEQCRGARG